MVFAFVSTPFFLVPLAVLSLGGLSLACGLCLLSLCFDTDFVASRKILALLSWSGVSSLG